MDYRITWLPIYTKITVRQKENHIMSSNTDDKSCQDGDLVQILRYLSLYKNLKIVVSIDLSLHLFTGHHEIIFTRQPFYVSFIPSNPNTPLHLLCL